MTRRQAPRLIYRTHTARKHGGGQRKGFAKADYAALLDAPHQPLGGPLVVVWGNLNAYVSHAMTGLITARPWLTVFRLPPYVPELNPRRTGLVAPQALAGHPHQTQHRRADHAGEDPAQAHAVPARPA